MSENQQPVIDYDLLAKTLTPLLAPAVAKIVKEQISERETDPELVDRNYIMNLHKVSYSTVKRWEKEGKLPKSVQKGKSIRFPKKEIDKIDSRT